MDAASSHSVCLFRWHVLAVSALAVAFSVMQISSTTGGRAAGSASASEPGDASSGSRGSASASQPGQTTRKLTPTVLLRLGSFNFGVEQNQLESEKPKELGRLLHALGGKVARCVLDADLDFFFGCEVGGHRAGLPAAGLEYGTYSWMLSGLMCKLKRCRTTPQPGTWAVGSQRVSSCSRTSLKSSSFSLRSSLVSAMLLILSWLCGASKLWTIRRRALASSSLVTCTSLRCVQFLVSRT